MKDIFKEIEEIRTRLYGLSAYIEKECTKPKMFPQEGEEYWFYDWQGNVTSGYAADSKGRLNAFRTKEEAIKARDIQWAKQRVAHAIAVENDGWKPNFEVGDMKNYAICIHYGLIIDWYSSIKMQPTWMHMKSKEIAEKILAEYEADLLLILSE